MFTDPHSSLWGLNESPSEKEGKFQLVAVPVLTLRLASMKVPPKRKGNTLALLHLLHPNGSPQ